MMKKFIFTLLMLVVGLSASAGDATGKALTVRTQIKSYLQSEGYTPKIDSDGDVQFKFQGGTYWVVCSNWRSQVYVTVFSQLDIEGCSLPRVRIAADEAQREYKFVRLNVSKTSNNIGVSISVPVQSASEFTNNFATFVDIISDAKQMCKDVYNNE